MRIEDLKGHKVGICVSGGLDSKTVTTRLKKAGADVLCFTANLAQPDEKDVNDIKQKMAPTGAETVIVDLRKRDGRGRLHGAQEPRPPTTAATGTPRASAARSRCAACSAPCASAAARCSPTAPPAAATTSCASSATPTCSRPNMKVYAPWRDPALLSRVPGPQGDGRLPARAGHRSRSGRQEALLHGRQPGGPVPRSRGPRVASRPPARSWTRSWACGPRRRPIASRP